MHLVDRTISILLRCLMWYFQTSLAQIHSKNTENSSIYGEILYKLGGFFQFSSCASLHCRNLDFLPE